MGSKIQEMVLVLLALVWACVGFEDNSQGEEKKAAVIKIVTEAIDSKEGIYVAPGAWRDIIIRALPFGVMIAVMTLNKFRLFSKSS